MFEIGWSEIAVIAVVAIVVVGPKDLPRMLRAFGKTMGQVRRTANDFKRQFDDALREAEKEADLDDTRKALQSMTKLDPLADIKKDLDATLRKANSPGSVASFPAAPVPAPAPSPDTIPNSSAVPDPIAPKAEPGSDAA